MNAAINLADTYSSMNKFDEATETLLNALKLSDVDKDKLLFMRIYIKLSGINEIQGDYAAAYEYQKMARRMQGNLYNKRIETQIYEMTAKYNLQEKENKIKEGQHKNKI